MAICGIAVRYYQKKLFYINNGDFLELYLGRINEVFGTVKF